MFTAGTSGRSCGNWQASMTHSIDSVEIHAIRIKCFRDALFIRKRRSTNSSKPQRRGMQASDTGRLSMFISVVEALQVRGEVGGRLSDLSAKNFFSWISQVIIIARGGGEEARARYLDEDCSLCPASNEFYPPATRQSEKKKKRSRARGRADSSLALWLHGSLCRRAPTTTGTKKTEHSTLSSYTLSPGKRPCERRIPVTSL